MTKQAIRPYRHRTGRCSRLLFEGYLAPGTKVRLRCPKCGLMHVVTANTTGVMTDNGHGQLDNI